MRERTFHDMAWFGLSSCARHGDEEVYCGEGILSDKDGMTGSTSDLYLEHTSRVSYRGQTAARQKTPLGIELSYMRVDLSAQRPLSLVREKAALVVRCGFRGITRKTCLTRNRSL
jgi:hypothetical protein